MKNDSPNQLDHLFDRQVVGLVLLCAVAVSCSRYGPFPDWHRFHYRSLLEHFISGFVVPFVFMPSICGLFFSKRKKAIRFLKAIHTIIQELNGHKQSTLLLGVSAVWYVFLSALWEFYQYIFERNYRLFQIDQLLCDIAGVIVWCFLVCILVRPPKINLGRY